MDCKRRQQQRDQELFVTLMEGLRNGSLGRRIDLRREVVVSRTRVRPDERNDVAKIEYDRRGAIRRRLVEIGAAKLDRRCLHHNTRYPKPHARVMIAHGDARCPGTLFQTRPGTFGNDGAQPAGQRFSETLQDAFGTSCTESRISSGSVRTSSFWRS